MSKLIDAYIMCIPSHLDTHLCTAFIIQNIDFKRFFLLQVVFSKLFAYHIFLVCFTPYELYF